MATATELPINTGASALQLANEIFGEGVTVTSATYSGDYRSSGIYSNGDTVSPDATPGDTGVILSTGKVTDFTNSSGTSNTNLSASTTTDTQGVDNDADFNAIAGTKTYDAAFLEVQFTPVGDLLTIDFVLSSEEYPEYIGTDFNDVIGVWVNGVQAHVTIGDGSASIGNVNGGVTSNLYHDNTQDQFNTEMDGFTVTLTFVAPVNPGEINTIKIGVADVSDAKYDTNLLIAGGSVQTAIVAQDDLLTMGHNDTKVLDVLDNDHSAGGALTITHINGTPVAAGDTITLGSGQQVTLNADGTFTIAGDSDGEKVYFNYSVLDETGHTDTAMVAVEQVPCFVRGTLIATPQGEMPIEWLRPGMLVCVQDGPPQPVRWLGWRTVPATGAHRPVLLNAGPFGLRRPLMVSQQHRMMLSGAQAELMFGQPEVLIKARDLIDGQSVCLVEDLDDVTYVHLLFDRHEVITANGAPSESYLPGPQTMPGFDAATQAELRALFPEIGPDGTGYGPAARLALSSKEARPLCRAMTRPTALSA